MAALRDQVAAALAQARHTGWDGLLAEQRAYLDDFWERADVEIEGDAELQQAVRFALFHVLQAGARGERRRSPPRADRPRLRRPRLLGHRDVRPAGADLHAPRTPPRDALRWRHATLELARDRAELLGLRAPRSRGGRSTAQECSGYWPAGTAAFHVNADIADAVVRYQAAADDAGVRARRRASSCWSRRRGCGARSATTTPPGASASTASPAPTSTARSPTTTSTRT